MKLTPALEQNITAFIRAGGFAHVAAEAAGVPRIVFDEWLEKGQRPRAAKKYRLFYIAILQAQAQARLRAEVKALEEKPMDWLKSGPGRQKTDAPGWTAPARATPASADKDLDMLRHPGLQYLMSLVLDVLAPFPDARAAMAKALENVGDPEPVTKSQ